MEGQILLEDSQRKSSEGQSISSAIVKLRSFVLIFLRQPRQTGVPHRGSVWLCLEWVLFSISCSLWRPLIGERKETNTQDFNAEFKKSQMVKAMMNLFWLNDRL